MRCRNCDVIKMTTSKADRDVIPFLWGVNFQSVHLVLSKIPKVKASLAL